MSAYLAAYATEHFSTFTEKVFKKLCTDLHDITDFCRTGVSQGHGDVALSQNLITYTLSTVELINTIFENHGGAVFDQAEKQYHLLTIVKTLLTNDLFCELVHHRVFTLLGNLVEFQSGPTDPPLSDFIDIISSKIDNGSSLLGKLRSGALWSLTTLARHHMVDSSQLFGLIDPLIAIFKRTEEDPCCIINAATALTNICSRRADQSVAVICRHDVFLHLSGLLQASFPRSFDKIGIFQNVCAMLSPAMTKIDCEMWSVFLVSVAQSDDVISKSAELQSTLKTLLRDLKNTVGPAKWNKLLKDIGPGMNSIIRRRFRMN